MAAPEGYKALGKIGISYKGDYNPNTVYERLDAVYHNGSTYLAIKDAPDGAPRNDKINWIYLAKGYDGETVDVAESEIVFTESETRENIGSGEKVSTVFGKIKKFFTDLTAPAFAQMITTKEDLLATKVTGYVPDAKAVADAYTELNGKLTNKQDKTNYTILAPYSHTGTCDVKYNLPNSWRTLIVFSPNNIEVGRVNKTGEIDSFLNISVSYSDGMFHFSGLKYYTNICIIFTWL